MTNITNISVPEQGQLVEVRQRLLVVSFIVYKIANIRQALARAAKRGVHIKICVEAPNPSEGKVTYDTETLTLDRRNSL